MTHPVDPSPPRKASVPPLPTVAMLFSPAAEGQGGDGDLMGSIMRDHLYIYITNILTYIYITYIYNIYIYNIYIYNIYIYIYNIYI